MTRDLQADLALARTAAVEALALVGRMRVDGVRVSATKTSEVDVVTAADEAAQALLRDRLLTGRPEDGFLGEEGDDDAGSSGLRWVVDPIDGTVNYLYGITDHCVSVGLEDADGPVVGVIAAADGRVATAVRGGGAHVDGTPLRVRTPGPLAQRLVATGFSYDVGTRVRQAECVARMVAEVRDVRRHGSCALDLLAVASGRVDAYVEQGSHAWDRSAGSLLATEAGARYELWPVEGAEPGLEDLVVCAPEAGFDDFAGLVRRCGFTGNNAGY